MKLTSSCVLHASQLGTEHACRLLGMVRQQRLQPGKAHSPRLPHAPSPRHQATVAAAVERKAAELATLRQQLQEAQAAAQVRKAGLLRSRAGPR